MWLSEEGGNMLTCSEGSIKSLQNYVAHGYKFISYYRWIVDSYVSDFFVHDHWDKLPRKWTLELKQMSPSELSFLLSSGTDEIRLRRVLPLSLLCYKACTQYYSADRTPSGDSEAVWKTIFRPSTGPESKCAETGIQKASFSPVDDEGVLHYFYKKHVKPKKQHEILQLGKVISRLSQHCSCEHVVDVGAGLGHLARLLSFGFGLKVTSVEAADGHAPKANKFDREMETEIKKKKLKNSGEGDLSSLSSPPRPSHVICMIYPDTSAADFLRIVQDKCCQDGSTEKYTQQINESTSCQSDRNTNVKLPQNHDSFIEEATGNSVTNRLIETADVLSEPASCVCQDDCRDDERCVRCTKTVPDVCQKDQTANCDNFGATGCDTDLKKSKTVTLTCRTSKEGQEYRTQMEQSFNATDGYGLRKRSKSSSNAPWDFILTGLHACGDLTPTFLRCFVNCSNARGLASVGCCYMKLTERQESTLDSHVAGYPMSEFVSRLPGHQLSYLAQELACHFADTYHKRLKEESPHLKIHCYRAALEWLCSKVSPNFKRASVQIPPKKTTQISFEKYARLGFTKLGLCEDLLTPDLLSQAEKMLPGWKDVVAFYTLRLSLAPVIETVILIDRMIYLYEHGIGSTLVPVFDPQLSPRNFALLAWK